jgi:hypothetical protein
MENVTQTVPVLISGRFKLYKGERACCQRINNQHETDVTLPSVRECFIDSFSRSHIHPHQSLQDFIPFIAKT